MSSRKRVDVTYQHERGHPKLFQSCFSLLSCVILSEALFPLWASSFHWLNEEARTVDADHLVECLISMHEAQDLICTT